MESLDRIDLLIHINLDMKTECNLLAIKLFRRSSSSYTFDSIVRLETFKVQMHLR